MARAGGAAPLLLLGVLFLVLLGALVAMVGVDREVADTALPTKTPKNELPVANTSYTWYPDCSQGTPYLRIEIDNGMFYSVSVVYDTSSGGTDHRPVHQVLREGLCHGPVRQHTANMERIRRRYK